MNNSPDLYAILGVSPSSDDVVIRAAFKALMLKYHPDTNRTSGATERATAINAAFAVLGNPKKRAVYDAAHSQWRAKQSSASSPGPPPSPPTPPPSDAASNTGRKASESPPSKVSENPSRWWTAGAVVIIVGLIRLASTQGHTDASVPSLPLVDVNATEGMDTNMDSIPVQASPSNDLPLMDNGATAFSGPANTVFSTPALPDSPDSISFDDIETATRMFARLSKRAGMVGARSWSRNCHVMAQKSPSWSAADRCAAFDFAASYVDQKVTRSLGTRPDTYFQFEVDNQADNYRPLHVPTYAVNDRLRRIKEAAEPSAYDAVSAENSRMDQRSLAKGTSSPEPPSENDPGEDAGQVNSLRP